MSVMATLRELSEVWTLFSNMPDDTTLGVDLAALYLGISVKTLARYRQNGDGPSYIQYQSEDSKARNQRVNYLLGDLRSWRDIHKVKSTMHAAQVRGLTFTSMSDFIKKQPYLLVNEKLSGGQGNRLGNGKIKFTYEKKIILGHILSIQESIFYNFLRKNDISAVWISTEKAIQMEWVDAKQKETFTNIFIKEVERIIGVIKVNDEKSVLTHYQG
ncbi:hypothetical protein Q2P25_002115 [Escherichia coli]|nr:hypothetical protein [Escherichia coli]ELM7733412.1 hypothetical protein [Escherichia coli]ELM7796515.1 hypothetical protein [Escherichia coli]ELM7806245.1 hypothetical protein [Escherichia coli]ELM7810738.1 hypothetical protein [Escherichia coli]